MLSGAKALFMVFLLDSKGAKACKSCRSRQELSNEYFLFTCKMLRRYSRERASQSLQKIVQIFIFQSLPMSLFSNEYLLVTCKIWRRYSRERASQSLPKISQKLETKLEKNIGLERTCAAGACAAAFACAARPFRADARAAALPRGRRSPWLRDCFE